MRTRREFLHTAGLVSLTPLVPTFLARAATAMAPERDSRVLVILQLDGGNDGINTLVPHAAEPYRTLRPTLALAPSQLVPLNEGVGLHPAFRALSSHLERGHLAFLQGVGYPNPSRSHFESMAIWHTALPAGAASDGTGWLGRAFDATPAAIKGTPTLLLGGGQPPGALRGRRSGPMALERWEDLANLPPSTLRPSPKTPAGDDLVDYVRRSMMEGFATAERGSALQKTDRAPYPASALGEKLSFLARLLKVGMEARVYYVVQAGYDTHADQLPTHGALLTELADAVKAFLDDLEASRLADRVVLMAFSEFGRRVAENGSRGTDHGSAGPIMLAGTKVRGGLHGTTPRLDDLERGDLKVSMDFRRVYASVLEGWLGLPAEKILGAPYEPLPLWRT